MLNVKSRKHLQLRIWRLRGKKTSENEKKNELTRFRHQAESRLCACTPRCKLWCYRCAETAERNRVYSQATGNFARRSFIQNNINVQGSRAFLRRYRELTHQLIWHSNANRFSNCAWVTHFHMARLYRKHDCFEWSKRTSTYEKNCCDYYFILCLCNIVTSTLDNDYF